MTPDIDAIRKAITLTPQYDMRGRFVGHHPHPFSIANHRPAGRRASSPAGDWCYPDAPCGYCTGYAVSDNALTWLADLCDEVERLLAVLEAIDTWHRLIADALGREVRRAGPIPLNVTDTEDRWCK